MTETARNCVACKTKAKLEVVPYHHDKMFVSRGPWKRMAEVEMLLCFSCGHAEFAILDPEALKEAHEVWKQEQEKLRIIKESSKS